MSYDLGTIRRNAPIDTELAHYIPGEGDPAAAAQIMTRLELFKLMERLHLTPGAAQMLRSLQGLHQMPMPPMGKVSGGGQSMSSVRMSDANGTIVVSSNSRTGTTVHVTDSAGKVLYSGPYNTQEEKSAVPEAVRERLKNIETNFCF